MEPSAQAEAVIGAGRGALVEAMFGSGWLGWGLGGAHGFNGLTGPALGFTTLFLMGWSIYTIEKGRRFRKRYPGGGASARRTVRKWFLLVALMEVVGILFVSILASRLHRADLAGDWCAMIVGLHFLPLGKIFRAPNLIVLGVLMVLWCALCWALFRTDRIALSASLGTGILLWGSCIFVLIRARRIARSLSA